MPEQQRYAVKICFEGPTIKTVHVVLEEGTKKRVFLVSGKDLIELDDCSHNCQSPKEPVHATSKLKLKGLGRAFGMKLNDGRYHSDSKSFIFRKNTKSGVRVPADWEATDGGPWPNVP